MAYLKKLVWTKSFNTKQCPAGLSPRIIPHVFPFLPKMSPLLMLFCCPHQVRTVPAFVWTFVGNPRDRSIIPPSSQKFSHFLHQKISINKFRSSAIKNVISCLSDRNFHKSPYTYFISSCNYCCCIFFFLISGFVYIRVTLILINRRLLNVVFSMMTKELNGPSSP